MSRVNRSSRARLAHHQQFYGVQESRRIISDLRAREVGYNQFWHRGSVVVGLHGNTFVTKCGTTLTSRFFLRDRAEIVMINLICQRCESNG